MLSGYADHRGAGGDILIVVLPALTVYKYIKEKGFHMQKITFRHRNNKILNLAPTRIIVLSFAAIIFIGTILLNLPAASRDGKSIGLLDAFFTSASATCITGMTVVDTYRHWTTFGQLVIISLVQAGGLGIITLTTFFSVLLGRKMSLRSMILAQESINHFSFEGVLRLVSRIVTVTLIVELAGALLLSSRFVPQYGPMGFYLGIFHSVSAFCNAGFDLMSIAGRGDFTSLTLYNNDPIVLYTVAALIVFGGLGFVVWKDLYDYRKKKYLMLHTKIVLTITLFLTIFGAILFLTFEYGNPETMGGLDFTGKLNSAVFQSITTRTAGFNSVDIGGMKEISRFLTVILMFIGAAPGSTGGGIKVTTFGVLLFAILSQIRGADETILFRRRVSTGIVNKALAITGFGTALVLIVTTIILAIENKPFLNVLFDVTSAFGTTGLTTGLTPDLHYVSKLLLALTMFLGRVGPVTFAIALTLRSRRTDADIIHPEGKVIVG
jgi:trk system potassium uptake protein TrkH